MGSFAALQSSVARGSSPASPASPEAAAAEHRARRRAVGLLAAATAATQPRLGDGARGETRRGARAVPASGISRGARGGWECGSGRGRAQARHSIERVAPASGSGERAVVLSLGLHG